jgi:hypothetical protein
MEKSLIRDAIRALHSNRFEQTEDGGLFVPANKLTLRGVFDVEHWRAGELIGQESAHNLVVNQGLNHILNVVFNAATQVTTWYVGLFEGNYTPVAGDTAATFPSNATESTAYGESTRPAFVEAASTAQSITNSANKAEFTMNATKTIYGAFLSSVSTKGGTTGTLAAAARFASSRSVVAADLLRVTYTINASAS